MPSLARSFMPTYAQDALRDAVRALQEARIESASVDARLLLQHVLGISREQLLAADKRVITSEQEAQYMQLIARRAARQPVAQLIGKREFYGREFKVTGDTLDPRPDSETLIEAVLARIADKNAPLRLLDLGTGTGCLLLTLLAELPKSQGIAVDACEKALDVAKTNASALSVGNRAQFVKSSWAEGVSGVFDVVISNPPYIPSSTIPTLAPEVCQYEPKAALDGGEDGLECYRAIIAQLPGLLGDAGFAAFEIGIGQHKALESIASQNGLQIAGMKEDLAGIVRCVVMTKAN